MRFPNRLLLCCAAILAVSAPCLAADDTPEQARAREALRQAMGSPAARTAPAPSTARPAATNIVAVPPGADSDATARAREALREKMAQMESQTQTNAPPGVAVTKQQEKEAKAQLDARTKSTEKAPVLKPSSQAGKAAPMGSPKPAEITQPAFAAMQGPPPPVSAEKQRRLAELLERYRADTVTPEEYQRERAKIIADP